MSKPHVHGTVIKQWADGAIIQYFSELQKKWMDYPPGVPPSWNPGLKYRIKPEPKPDVVVQCYANGFEGAVYRSLYYDSTNLLLTFDGETMKLKKAEVI